MAMEVPCIATWIAGIPELILDGVEGLLVPPASVEAIVDAVIRLMDNPEQANSLGVAGRKKVLISYNLERNISQLAEEFREQLAAARP
jgi:colanic acid/amylovoran biosynthesis glycosyltransferase